MLDSSDYTGEASQVGSTLPQPLLRYNHELEAVNELAEMLTLGKGIDAILNTALSRMITLMEFDVGSIYLFNPENETLQLKASQGLLTPSLLEVIASLNPKANPLHCILDTGHAIVVEDLLNAPDIPHKLAHKLHQEGFSSWACAPLKMEGKVIGVYHLGKRNKRTFDSHDLALLEMIGNFVGASLSNAQLLMDLRNKEAELRRALHRAVEIQEEERKRLARELHDEIGQALTSILFHLKTMQEQTDTQTFQERLDDARFLAAQTIEELRRLAMDLRPAVLDNLGIVPSLRWYTQQCAERSGLDIRFMGPDNFVRLSPEIELTLYRIAQEGLTNAIRHGRAQKIVVFLERDLEQNLIRLSIMDDGTGFNMAALDRGLGLVGIRERVALLNGTFNIETSPGSGTQLWIEIPLKK